MNVREIMTPNPERLGVEAVQDKQKQGDRESNGGKAQPGCTKPVDFLAFVEDDL